MFDSKLLYVIQALLIGGVLYAIVWRQHRMLRLQVITWTIGVSAIAWRYGRGGQLGFYSNDQLQYAAIVRILMNWQWYEGESATLFWWTEYSKIPYPGAAVPLALAGVHVALALKTVSLVCLLALSRELLQRYGATRFTDQIKILYLTGCGLIGTFFSLVALRDTMMMYFTYRYVTDRSLTGRLLAIVVVFLLRSHLAAALVVAEIVLAVWRWTTRGRRLGFAEAPALIIIGATLGYVMFSWRFNGAQGYNLARKLETPFTGNYGITETLQTASNFAGLQFLTAHEAFIKLSIADLLLLRIVFSDTIIIPLGFTIVCIIFGNRLRERHLFTLLTFSIYVSIVTNTDFNSFRQNIPLMPVMGMVLLDILYERRREKELSRRSTDGSPDLVGATVSAPRET
jgi:hypothetical protein